MTRKCALCKETNYKKNNYSFFSAPKDAETRKKWQIALAINNLTVTDDTYVCSRHFHKRDIITHWISGVPPQVIKIKYKKFRLRPGAVPNKNFYSVSGSQLMEKRVLNKREVDVKNILAIKKKEMLEENEIFLIPRKEKNLSDDDAKSKDTDVCHRTSPKPQTYECNYDENDKSYNIQLPKYTSQEDMHSSTHDSELKKLRSRKRRLADILEYDDSSSSDLAKVISESTDMDKEDDRIFIESLRENVFNETVEYDIERYDSSEDGTSVETWERNVISKCYTKEKTEDDNLKVTDDSYTDNQISTALDIQDIAGYDEVDKEILFEDFLEIYTEASIPRGWSCLVTSKGHSTTVVYLCMDITKDGLPFVEKQVFIKNDMVLRYATANHEIDSLTHNLTKDRRCDKVRNLPDIEIAIDEFDRRIICQGVHDPKDYKDADITNAYKDGIKWRHVSCPLIVNNNSSRCTKCTALSHKLSYKS